MRGVFSVPFLPSCSHDTVWTDYRKGASVGKSGRERERMGAELANAVPSVRL